MKPSIIVALIATSTSTLAIAIAIPTPTILAIQTPSTSKLTHECEELLEQCKASDSNENTCKSRVCHSTHKACFSDKCKGPHRTEEESNDDHVKRIIGFFGIEENGIKDLDSAIPCRYTYHLEQLDGSTKELDGSNHEQYGSSTEFSPGGCQAMLDDCDKKFMRTKAFCKEYLCFQTMGACFSGECDIYRRVRARAGHVVDDGPR